MEFSFKIEGLDQVTGAFPALERAVEAETRKALYASAKKVEGDAKRSIAAGGKTGKVYKRGTVSHQASAPGEAPATDTGRLVNSINAYPPADKLESTVVAGRGVVNYAAHLEFGTKTMAARPFLFPALESSKEWIRDRLARAVKDGIDRAKT